MIFIATILGAVFNRLRGGWLVSTLPWISGHGKPANIAAFGALCWCVSNNPIIGVLMSAGMYGGQSFGWDGPIMRIQRDARDWRAVLLLSLRGMLWTSFFTVATAYFIGVHALLFYPLGLLMGPVYWACMRIYNPRSLSEIIWGAVMWAGTATILTKVN